MKLERALRAFGGGVACVTLATALCAVAVLTGCQDVPAGPETGPGSQDVAEASVPEAVSDAPVETTRPRVRTRTIELSAFEQRLRVTGTVGAWDEVFIATELGGMVRDVSFDKGDRVRKGQLLARVGDDLAAARLDEARATLDAATANHEQIAALFDRQAVPRDRLIAATAELERAKASVREREILLDRSRIKAPISGIATSRDIEPGEVVPPASSVTRISRVDRLKVTAAVPDTEISWVKEGRAATIALDAWPDRTFPAEISWIAPTARDDSRSFDVELALDNRDGTLRPGLVARVDLVKRRIDDGVVVPLDALVSRVDGRVAYVVEECVARERRVVLTAQERERGLVLEGLSAGDELVVEGQADLSDGVRIASERCP